MLTKANISIREMTHENLQLAERYFRDASSAGHFRARTEEKYRVTLDRFLKDVGKKFIDITTDDINDFTYRAQKRGNANSTICGTLHAVKWIIKELQEDGVIDKEKINLNKVIFPKIDRKGVMYLTIEEIKKFFALIEAEIKQCKATRIIRTMTLYTLLLESGARISEALSIKIKDVDLENREIPIIGKGGKPRTLFIRDKSVYWIKRYLEKRQDRNEYLFVNRAGDNQWSYNDVCRSFQRYKKLSGISKDFTIHTFRHTFATQLLLNGLSINKVSFLLGHERLETTIKYYIGIIDKMEARKIEDKYFDFVPQAALKVSVMQ